MPWSTWKRLVQQKNGSFFFLPTVNAYQYLTSLKVCDRSGHTFGASGSPRSFKKNGHVTLFHCSWRSAWYQICDIRVANACGIRGWRNLEFYAWNSSYFVHYFETCTTEYEYDILPAAHPEEPSYTYAEIPAINNGIAPVAPVVFLIFIHFF